MPCGFVERSSYLPDITDPSSDTVVYFYPMYVAVLKVVIGGLIPVLCGSDVILMTCTMLGIWATIVV
jgi:hypothetical protein